MLSALLTLVVNVQVVAIPTGGQKEQVRKPSPARREGTGNDSSSSAHHAQAQSSSDEIRAESHVSHLKQRLRSLTKAVIALGKSPRTRCVCLLVKLAQEGERQRQSGGVRRCEGGGGRAPETAHTSQTAERLDSDS